MHACTHFIIHPSPTHTRHALAQFGSEPAKLYGGKVFGDEGEGGKLVAFDDGEMKRFNPVCCEPHPRAAPTPALALHMRLPHACTWGVRVGVRVCVPES